MVKSDHAAPLERVDPLAEKDYDELLATHSESRFFHTAPWARVLNETYGYEPHYFILRDGRRLDALLALMEVKSFVTGRRGISLPFSDYCEPLTGTGMDFGQAVECARKHAADCGWSYVEIRSGARRDHAAPASSAFYRHTLSLADGVDSVYRVLKKGTKRNIRKAQKEGVEVKRDKTPEAMELFYRLNCLTRKRHGLPPQPLRFFRNVQEHVILPGAGEVLLAWHGGRCVAGAVFFAFNGHALYKYGASDCRYQHLRANNLVMWEAIRGYADDGCRTFCFGRTETANEGLLRFKRGWGGSEEMVCYLKYDRARDEFVVGEPDRERFYRRVFRKTPLPILRAVGSVLYRHVA